MEDGVLEGMQSFDQELERLINEGVIDREVGLSYATNRTEPPAEARHPGHGRRGEGGADPPSAVKKAGAPARARQKPEPDSDVGLDDLIER